MKKFGKLLAILVLATMTVSALFAFTACELGSTNTSEYNIVFLDKDSAELSSVKVKKGEIPEFKGTYPVLPEETAEFVYAWKWDREIVAATQDTTYTLVLDAQKKSYTVVFKNGDEELQSGKVEYGVVPEYKGETPVKAGDAQYSYNFTGWDKAIVAVTGEVVYTAQFKRVINKYTVIFKNGDEEIQNGKVEYGVVPTYDGKTPEKPADAQYTYTFKGWDKELTAVKGDVVYTAQFDQTVNKYTVVFKNGEVVLQSGLVDYGIVPEYNGETPVKAGDAQHSYTFKGWDKDLTAVKGDIEYIAQFDQTVNKYTVVFKNGEVELQSGLVEYGVVPEYKGETPVKAGDAQHSYTFKGWDKDLTAVKGDVVYTAQFDQTVNKYTVTFKNGEVELQSGLVEYGVVPEYKGETPVKSADAQYTYTFKGWDKDIVAVTGDVVYTAQFDQTVNEYDVTFKNGDEVLKTIKLAYGSEITVPEDVKVEGYAIIGWEPEFEPVTANAEYVAILARVLTQADKDNFSAIISANPDDNYVLGEDIDFGNAELSHVANFGGIFDGMGYKLKNFKLKLGNLDGAGDYAFAFIIQNAGTIRNVGLYYSAPAKMGNNHSGVIRHNYGKIENVYVKISIDGEAPNYMGTVVGANKGSGTIDNVVVSWSGSTTSVVGPVAGANHNGTIRNAHAICNGVIAVTDLPYATGQSFGSETIENCANYEDVAAFLAAVDFTAEGWSKYWSIKDGNIVFGEEDPEPVEETTILTQANMANFVSVINANPNGKYALGSDIDFGGDSQGIISEFGGELDGRGYTLKNFKLGFYYKGKTSSGADDYGYCFIGKNVGNIKNIAIQFTFEACNSSYEGFISENTGVVTNVYAEVTYKKKGWYTSTLVGINNGGTVSNCITSLTSDGVAASTSYGTVVGLLKAGKIINCYAAYNNAMSEAPVNPCGEKWGGVTISGCANYETLAEMAAGATFNEADGWDMTYFAKTFKAVNDLKNA